MPAASGPYQSRIFNFLHQQSRRVSEQLGTAFRHLQVVTSRGAQAILYMLFQSNELAGKQLHSFKQNWLPLPPDDGDTQEQIPTVDRPIQRVLHFVREGGKEEGGRGRGGEREKENNWQFVLRRILFPATSLLHRKERQKELFAPPPSPAQISPPPPLSTRGIATQLATRTLVLVTAENEILDILTPQQQRKLEERIIEEVAEYWHCWQLTAANESIHSAQALAVVDRTVAVESTQTASVSAGAITSLSFAKALIHRSWELVLAVPTQLASLSGKMVTDNTQQAALAKLNQVIAADTQPHRFKIHALIWAAINYFFGNRGEPKLEQSTVRDGRERVSLLQKLVGVRFNLLQPFGLKSEQHQAIEDEVDPWLTVSDLFGTSESKDKPAKHHSRELSASRLTNLNLFLSSRNHKKQIFTQTTKSKASSVTSVKRGKKQQLEDIVQHNPPPSSSSVSYDLLCSNSSTQIDPAPDWIEVQATVIGYVKHPLEQLLQWLDHLLLWIEELFMKVLEWAQHRTAR